MVRVVSGVLSRFSYLFFVVFLFLFFFFFFFSSRRRHTRSLRDWSSDVCSCDLRLTDVPSNEVNRWPTLHRADEACCVSTSKIGRASCREECRSRWSPYH